MSGKLSQSGHLFKLQTPLTEDELVLTAFTGTEAISTLFSFQLEMYSDNTAILPEQLLGKPLNFCINQGSEPLRYFHGIVNRFYIGPLAFRNGRRYRAEIVPWFWWLTCTTDCRIFQNLSTKKIITKIFQEFGFSDYSLDAVKGGNETRTYCVQYHESALDFITRLLEEEGIYYYFRHENDKHTLVLADSGSGYKASKLEVSYTPNRDLYDGITHWECQYSLGGSGKWSQDSYDFENPAMDLEKSSASTLKQLSSLEKYESYRYVGQADHLHKNDSQAILAAGRNDAQFEMICGESTCPAFEIGNEFAAVVKKEEKETFVAISLKHEAADTSYFVGDTSPSYYRNSFRCIAKGVPYLPPKTRQKTRIQGLQTAVVIGPEGEEVHTDKYGRINLRFHWDRKGKAEKGESACWIRVAQVWAGKGWGTLFIPRIGQEVVVSFLDGDPEQPLVVGSVYNALQMPPYELPANATQSGIKTKSSKQGGEEDANELRFEDKNGEELITLHAQKDLHTIIGNDETNDIKNNRTTTIAEGNETLVLKKGHQILNLETGNSEETIKSGNRTITLNTGNDTLEIKQGNQTIKLAAGKSSLEAMQGIELKVGANSLVIDASGISLKCVKLSIAATTAEIKTDANLKLQGAIVDVNGSAIVKLQGALTTIN